MSAPAISKKADRCPPAQARARVQFGQHRTGNVMASDTRHWSVVQTAGRLAGNCRPACQKL